MMKIIGVAALGAATMSTCPAYAAAVYINYSITTPVGMFAGPIFDHTAQFSGTVLVDETAGSQANLPISSVALLFDGRRLDIDPATVNAFTSPYVSGQGVAGQPGDFVLSIMGLTSRGDFSLNLNTRGVAPAENRPALRNGSLSVLVDGTRYAVSQALVTATSAVPEAATWAMMLVGIGAIGTALRVSRRRVSVSQPAFA